MRLATFNVENLFSRPTAMSEATWAEGQPALDDAGRLNALFQKSEYRPTDRREMLRLLGKFGLLSRRPQNRYLGSSGILALLLVLMASCTPRRPVLTGGRAVTPPVRQVDTSPLAVLQRHLVKDLSRPGTSETWAKEIVWFLQRTGARTADLAVGLRRERAVQRRTIIALGERGGPEAGDLLLKVLPLAADLKVEPLLAWALSRPGAQVVPTLIQALRHARAETREQAAQALGWISSAATRLPLQALLTDPSPRVRSSAAWALGRLGASAILIAHLAKEKDLDVFLYPNQPLVEVVFELQFPGEMAVECQRCHR